MTAVDTQELLSIPEAARRLGISSEDAFDLAFRTRELPIVFRGNDHGVPAGALEDYRRSHTSS